MSSLCQIHVLLENRCHTLLQFDFNRPAKRVNLRLLEKREAIVADLVQLVEAAAVEAAALLRRISSVAESSSDDESSVGGQSGDRTDGRQTDQDKAEQN